MMRQIPKIIPQDEHNTLLVSNVHPADWVAPEPAKCYNLVVIGAGTGGLVTAAGAAGLGARVALVERHLLGGDCLNVGCVPSKCLIRSSRAVADIHRAPRLGIHLSAGAKAEADFPAVMERMRRLRAHLSQYDSAKRFQGLGVDVFLGEGFFSGPDTIQTAGKTLRFKKAVIATGARAAQPAIEGLAEAGFLTNETVFSLTRLPKRLAVVGGGPLGCELAQAFSRLGAQVTIFHKHSHLLTREEAEAAEILQRVFVREGIHLMLEAKPKQVECVNAEKIIHFESNGKKGKLSVDEILIGAGRVPNVEGLNLQTVGVKYDAKNGVLVNDYLQTSNPRIYAVGDICLRHKFTHTADAAARLVIQNALFIGRKKASALTVPWCTYTDPEIAHVGLSADAARQKGMAIDTFTRPLSEVDRAVLDGEEEGFVRIHLRRGSDKILGATIVARHAGEMLNEITLAMTANLGLRKIAGVIHPYPTQAEAIKKVADAYNRSRLTPTIKNLLRGWLAFVR